MDLAFCASILPIVLIHQDILQLTYILSTNRKQTIVPLSSSQSELDRNETNARYIGENNIVDKALTVGTMQSISQHSQLASKLTASIKSTYLKSSIMVLFDTKAWLCQSNYEHVPKMLSDRLWENLNSRNIFHF